MDISLIIDFLDRLKNNNNRDWFLAHKDEYEQARLAYHQVVQQLLDQLTLVDSELLGLEAKDCTYRIYRDIRFSHDKTPYKTYFGAYMARGGRKSPRAGYYLHIDGDSSFLVGGLWCPEPEPLKIVRQSIYDNEDELIEIMHQPDFKAIFGDFDQEGMLKRMPNAFLNVSCRHPEWLRLKSYVVIRKVDKTFFRQKDWLSQSLETFTLAYPLNKFLNYALDEAAGIV